MFIRDIRIFTIGRPNLEIDRGLSTVFKSVLERFHYRVDDCEEELESLLRRGKRMTDEQSARQETLLFESHCRTRSDAAIFDAELVLGVDPELGNRRAVLRFIPPFESSPPISGGYAQKPGEPKASWDDVISRAIERTLGGFNDPTSIQLTVPAQTSVGDVLQLDARNSWDEDGDMFELRWHVITTGCIGVEVMLPADHWPCPIGMNGPIEVFTQSGKKANMREFRVPIVGDYDIALHAKIGDREEPEHVFHVRANPRRSHTLFSQVAIVGLPDDFFSSNERATPALVMSFGYLGRTVHRIGLFGLYEELHLGASLGSIRELRDFQLSGAGAIDLGLEITGRTMDRTGRFGLAQAMSLTGFVSNGTRGNQPRTELGILFNTLMGIYIAFGENYVDKRSALCPSFCPSVTVGPTLGMMLNFETHKFAITEGGEIMMGVEF